MYSSQRHHCCHKFVTHEPKISVGVDSTLEAGTYRQYLVSLLHFQSAAQNVPVEMIITHTTDV